MVTSVLTTYADSEEEGLPPMAGPRISMTVKTDPAPLAPLSRQMILDAAVEFVDLHGLEQLTLRRLGLALDRDATAFYRHYRTKNDLLVALADKLLSDVLVGFEGQGDWADDLREILHRTRNVYLMHANLSTAIAYSPDALLSNARVHEVVLAALEESGLSEEAIPRYEVAIYRWTVGTSTYDASSGPLEPGDHHSDFASRIAFASLDPEQYPRCVKYAQALFPTPEASFDSGLELIIDSIRHATAHHATTPEGSLSV
jgi:AcrR family transcriptional regulator